MVFSILPPLFKRKHATSVTSRLADAQSLMAEGQDPVKGFSHLSVLAREGVPEAQFLVGQAYLNGTVVPANLVEGVRWVRRAAQKHWPDACFILATLYLYGLPPEAESEAEKTAASVFDTEPKVFVKPEANFEKSAYWAKIAATQGHADAQAMYGYVLCNGPEHIRNLEEGMVWYHKAVAAECVQGYLGLGLVILNTAQTDDEYKQAARYLKKAAESGLGTALYLMGVLAERGLGRPVDMAEAIQYYAVAADKNVSSAQAKYGMALMVGQNVAKDTTRGETFLRRAALSGDAEAAATLGDLYGRGGEFPPNYAEAIAWYRFASEHGHAAASYTLGTLYEEGIAVPQDPQEAERWFNKALELGHEGAPAGLGNLLLEGKISAHAGARVMKRYKEKADQGDLLSAFNFGVCLAEGVGVQKDEAEALKWLHKAAQGVVNAQYWYGTLLLTGKGAPPNLQEGRAWIEKAANAGMAQAELAYADLLLNGEGGEKNHEKALEFYRKAADAGLVWAMFSVGAMYGGGHDVPQDRLAAQKWFYAAAQKGNAAAQLMLGRYFAQGLAGEHNREQAKFWYQKAAAQNIPDAIKELAELTKQEDNLEPSLL